jgi:hypothetical protein
MPKALALIVSGAPEGQQHHDISIEPGTRAIDVLNQFNLQGYVLSREGSNQIFAAEEVLYNLVTEGDKIRASPVATVGADFAELLRQLRALPTPSPTPAPPQRVVVKRLRLVRIPASKNPLWKDRNWIKEGNRLNGAFRTAYGSISGEIRLGDDGPSYYIINPPKELLQGGHGACFRPRQDGRFWVHFSEHTSGNIDAGILAVEDLLAKAFRLTRREVRL